MSKRRPSKQYFKIESLMNKTEALTDAEREKAVKAINQRLVDIYKKVGEESQVAETYRTLIDKAVGEKHTNINQRTGAPQISRSKASMSKLSDSMIKTMLSKPKAGDIKKSLEKEAGEKLTYVQVKTIEEHRYNTQEFINDNISALYAISQELSSEGESDPEIAKLSADFNKKGEKTWEDLDNLSNRLQEMMKKYGIEPEGKLDILIKLT